jgi:peptide/nickel transport system substrate-binding protein
MRHFVWRCLVISSVLVAGLAARAESRPQYGGTLHIATRAALTSLDPADHSQPDSFARRSLTLLVFETLVTIDDAGRPHSVLATSWQASPTDQHWRFRLRRSVRFHDGTLLTPEVAAASLRSANPAWNVTTDGEAVVIDCESSDPELLKEVALPRNAIAKRNTDKPEGTGPFHIVDWQAGKKLTLAAEEDYWRGRPFLDGIEIEMGRNYRDQITALELGRTELAEVAPEQIHRAALEGRGLVSSEAMELLAVIFTGDAQTAEEKSLREALASSIERGSIRSVLLQGAGQAAAAILPNWISGYGFVFSTDADLPRARHARAQVRAAAAWTLGYDSSDPLARLVAERIALNGKDAGLSLQPTSAARVDLRLLRIPLASADPWLTLAEVAGIAGLPAPKNKSGSVEDLYATEQAMLATDKIIPLFHLPASYAAAATLKTWNVRPDGTLSLADAWLGNGRP